MNKDIVPSSPTYNNPTADFHRQLLDEGNYRSQQGTLGAIDLMLAAKGALVLGTIGEIVQTEREGYLAEEAKLTEMFPGTNVQEMMAVDPHGNNPLMLLGSIPLDLKAAAVGIAVFGAVSATRRIRRHDRFPKDAVKAVRQVQEADGFQPNSDKDTRAFRLRRRLADAALTSVAVVGSYQAAKHGSQMEDVVASTAISFAALGSISIAKIRDKSADRKLRNQTMYTRTGLGNSGQQSIQ